MIFQNVRYFKNHSSAPVGDNGNKETLALNKVTKRWSLMYGKMDITGGYRLGITLDLWSH
jgi:hypothetical protein